MKVFTLVFSLVVCGSLFAGVPDIRVVGDANLSTDTFHSGLRVGGLSGAFMASDQSLFAVSDDRYHPHIHRFGFGLSCEGLQVEVEDTILLKDSSDRPFARWLLDAEGIATAGARLFVSSEGNLHPDAGRLHREPSIMEFDPSYKLVREFSVPEKFKSRPDVSGVRQNGGFESLTVTPSGKYLYTANEYPLYQDGERSDFENSANVRLLKYDISVTPPKLVGEFAYKVSVYPEMVQSDRMRVRSASVGLSDLLAIDDDRLIALERTSHLFYGARSYVNIHRLFQVDTTDATNIESEFSLSDVDKSKVHFLKKSLFLDLSTILSDLTPGFQSLDSLEGIAYGPRFPDGSGSLVLVSDNNFDQNQRSQFILLSVKGFENWPTTNRSKPFALPQNCD